jgi:hypothetical protein
VCGPGGGICGLGLGAAGGIEGIGIECIGIECIGIEGIPGGNGKGNGGMLLDDAEPLEDGGVIDDMPGGWENGNGG